MGAPELEALRAHRAVADERFDRLYPEWVRRLGDVHWTPVEVALRAAELLVERPGARVLDAGSGVGKFCIVGALATPGRFVGIEQRAGLVEVAREVARRHGVARCRFLCGDMTAIDWSPYDGYYLYNPFEELVSGFKERIDRSIDLRRGRRRQYIDFVEDRLRAARVGTRVVTYHGYGGTWPDGWQCGLSEIVVHGRLALWVKTGETPPSRRTTS